MSIPKTTIRGVQSIRTKTGTVPGHFVAHEAYMRITCLEMEKARRAKERESAMVRVRSIDARFKEMEAEKAALLAALDERTADRLPSARQCGPGAEDNGFKIKY